MANNMTNIPASLEEDVKVQNYISRLVDLRSTGVTRMHKSEIDTLTKEAVSYVNSVSAEIEKKVNESENANIARYKSEYQEKAAAIKAETAKKIAALTVSDPKERKAEIEQIRYEEKSSLFDAKSHCTALCDRAKAAKNQAYVDHVQTNRTLRNGKTNFREDWTLKWKDYVNRFKVSTFLLNNGLYLAVLIFFIVCVIVAPLQGRGTLLSLPNEPTFQSDAWSPLVR